jgi:sigma-B regulation protein RsbU (phosphoserine phosphatase)
MPESATPTTESAAAATEPPTPTPLTRTERFDLRALYETSGLLSRSLDLDFVLNSLLLTAMSKLFTTRGVVLMRDQLSEGYRVSAVKGLKGVAVDDVVRLEGISDDDIMVDGEVPEKLREYDLVLSVPISFGSRSIGMLAMGPKATRDDFTTMELEFIRSLVNMSSTAVHNSLMVEELKLANRDLDSKIQELNTLFDLSQEFNATIDRDRLVRLLSFALMGQLLVSRHVFLLRRTVGGSADPDVYVVGSKGLGADDIGPEIVSALCGLDELLLLEDIEDDEGAGRAWESLRRLDLCLALPLRQHGETCGALCLGEKRTGQPYSPGDIEFLSALGNLALVSIQNSFLVEEQIEKERLEEEMRLARSIQERLLPQKVPVIQDYELAAVAIPSRFVGGDYYDLVELEGDRVLLAVADVTGKGVPASLLMANLQASLHVMLPMDLSIEEAVVHINRVICENTDYDKFITFFVTILDRSTGKLDYVNAGHNPPTIVRADGSLEMLETGGLLLGVMKDLGYEKGRAELRTGDVLAMFTDGVTEAMSRAGEEYGEERLEHLLAARRHGTAAEILKAVREDITAFTSGVAVLSDDLTMVVLKRV